MKSKHWILLLLVPLSEIKAIFYNSDLRVSWYLLSDNERFLCNVVEDYCNIIIMGTVFYYYLNVKGDLKTRNIILFLFIINALDFVHLGLMDMSYLIVVKLILALIILKVCNRLKSF
jgi:hypothetical protein